MSDIARDIAIAEKIALLVSQKGGRAYYVGGYVRDRLIKKENKDIDIEVHGIEESSLADILRTLGTVRETGKSFAVYGIDGYPVDIALPRTERPTGKGHRDFEITADAMLGTKNASRRRDFTINSIMQDVLTGEITDHFHGIRDLKDGIIRHTDSRHFCEDALRVLRAAQFGARLGFEVSDKTVELCRQTELRTLPPERVFDELKKALLKSDKPSVFFEILRSMNQLSYWFPELGALIGIRQNPVYHAEGDVWTHTMMVVDEAARLRDKASNPMAFMLSALCHDMGKAVSTTEVDGVIHAYGHEEASAEIAQGFLRRLTGEKALTKYVINMCRYHMKPRVLSSAKSSVRATNKLFDASCDPLGLIYIAEADCLGKLPRRSDDSDLSFLIERLSIYEDIMKKPHVTGTDLIAAGLSPDSNFKEILDYAHKLRLALVPKEDALKQVLSYARQKNSNRI